MADHKRRTGKNFDRKRGIPHRRRVLICVEGEATERDYFKGLTTHLKSRGVHVRPVDVKSKASSPEKVVEYAKRCVQYEKRAGQDKYDSVWCVLDVDSHVHLRRAVDAADKLGFGVAISNPHFGLWLLWHYCDCRRYMSGAELDIALKEWGISTKRMPLGFKYENVRDAIERGRHIVDAIPINPGSGVGRLCEFLMSVSSGHQHS